MPSKINYLLGIFLSILVLISHKPVFAINNPNLLPEEKTPVIDLAKTLSPNQKKSLEEKLNNLEIESGWKIKYLSQFESSPGSAIKDYWDLDETSLLIVADPRGGNLLNFNVERLILILCQGYFGLNFKQDLATNTMLKIMVRMVQY